MAGSKREKELARQRAERQAARRAASAARRKQRNAVIASVAAVALVAVAAVSIGLLAGGGDDQDTIAAETSSAPSPAVSEEPSSEPSAEPSSESSAEPSIDPAAGTSCTYEPTPEPAVKDAATPPTTDVEDELVLQVTMATDQGDIVFDMDTAAAPCTASSLRTLASVRYFDNTPCHRLTTQGISVLQCGDPTGTGSGGPGYQFADENLDGATYPRGTIAMANAGPGTNGSQFFVVYADSSLPPAYTPFGVITSGLEVLDKIAAAGSDGSSGAGDGKPNLPVVIETLRVTAPAA